MSYPGRERMGRKKDAQILNLELKVSEINKKLEIQKLDFDRFVEASKADWKYLREYCNQKIEGK